MAPLPLAPVPGLAPAGLQLLPGPAHLERTLGAALSSCWLGPAGHKQREGEEKGKNTPCGSRKAGKAVLPCTNNMAVIGTIKGIHLNLLMWTARKRSGISQEDGIMSCAATGCCKPTVLKAELRF